MNEDGGEELAAVTPVDPYETVVIIAIWRMFLSEFQCCKVVLLCLTLSQSLHSCGFNDITDNQKNLKAPLTMLSQDAALLLLENCTKQLQIPSSSCFQSLEL